MKWFKNDKDIQKSLLQLVHAQLLINNASDAELRKAFNQSQNKAIDIDSKVRNNSKVLQLAVDNILANNLLQALNFTITEYPLSQADVYNINIDINLLVHYFASKDTIIKTQKMEHPEFWTNNRLSAK